MCDSRQALRSWGCGAFLLVTAVSGDSKKPSVLVEVVWNGLS